MPLALTILKQKKKYKFLPFQKGWQHTRAFTSSEHLLLLHTQKYTATKEETLRHEIHRPTDIQ